MKKLFYKLVILITKMVTGLDNKNLTWDGMLTWIRASAQITSWLNIVCLTVVIGICVMIIIEYRIHKQH